LSANKHLRDLVASKLSKQWSPEQIAGWLAKRYPLDFAMQISHETIYKSLYVQARGVLKRELLKNLRTRRSFRHSRTSTDDGQGRGQIVDAVNISERPAEVEDRAIPGHWEGDLITGRRDTHIVTLVERQSRYVLLVKIPNKEAATVALALRKAIKTMPRQLRKSLTWDRGSEMAHHKDISLASKIEVYFCDPQSPWQRGSNENTNGLLRQYLPKGSDLSVHSQAQLNAIARRLNERPRMTLDFQTPAEVYSKAVALID
jgi:IS30 family transposase